ncbi:Uncharacterized conserved protein YtfP, gamma-glutamylcyclotransferase (GGCT)/AIG2-like family [Reichenbachiella agariperforans]|uniref:Uncharacterized conserved protein YtfP, gamma-glutamylcyclotransferase (GGCT)/AIG2-like family n=1 Tax=Reichenbachiella agariperforans TaxID=156994 RepID=A0A1M6UYC2_REIAG|nr:gamma-glutamylcyclotransferase family protein [Reichenbachiella agariperforans]SHK74252.1 Uncharacterized conserved protein YtfP, gamma-glutamylcyclotransferase (GGCT)/AIG2-like family [Reichenbachiella agariperforans]
MTQPSSPCYLFVYGTLMQTYDNPYATLLRSNSRFVSEGYAQGKIYKIDFYPGLKRSIDQSHKVYGQVYELTNQIAHVLQSLDEYEGITHPPTQENDYERVSIPIYTTHGLIDCWAYIYLRPVLEEEWVVSGRFSG